jgi:hypothetical protein
MGSFNSRHAFDPLDLEIIDKVYEAAYAYIVAQNLCDPERSAEDEDALRQGIFVLAATDSFDFDSLCDKVLANIAELRVTRGVSEAVSLKGSISPTSCCDLYGGTSVSDSQQPMSPLVMMR